MPDHEILNELLSLSHFLGEEHRNLAILGEGNTSAKIDDETFMDEFGGPPRVILLANHGLITLGKSSGAVRAGTLMAHKSAEIFVGAAALGGPVFMSDADVDRIANRIDEHYRQRALKL